jgi:hypothetical protein
MRGSKRLCEMDPPEFPVVMPSRHGSLGQCTWNPLVLVKSHRTISYCGIRKGLLVIFYYLIRKSTVHFFPQRIYKTLRHFDRSWSATVPMASSLHNNTTTLVYVQSKEHAWLPAQIVEGTDDGHTVTVHMRGDGPAQSTTLTTVALKDYPHRSLPLQNIDPSTGTLRVVADLADLSFLHEVRGHSTMY